MRICKPRAVCLHRYGIDYSQVAVPHCEMRITRSLEMGWNYIDGEEPVEALAAAFQKGESNLDELRDWEASH